MGSQALQCSPKVVHPSQTLLQGYIYTLVMSYASHATRLQLGSQALQCSPKVVHPSQTLLRGYIYTLVMSYASHATRLGGSKEDR